MKIFLNPELTDGCMSKTHLSNKVRNFLKFNNYYITDNPDDAQYILINTCGVVNTIEEGYLKLINLFLKNYGNSKKIIIYGCLGKISNKINSIEGIYKIINLDQEYLFNSEFKNSIPIEKIDSSYVNEYNNNEFIIQISRGCIHNCTYCGSKKSIGYVKSRSIDDIKNDFINALGKGYSDFILIADDISSYGYDIKKNFSDLFNELCKIKGNYSFTLDYMEASEFIKFYNYMFSNFYRIKEINLPVQSFNDRILLLMGRKYKINDYIEMIKKIRNINPSIIIRTVMIYGYPNETKEEFLSCIKGAKYFNYVSWFLYSYREGTKKFDNLKVLKKEEKMDRIFILSKLAKKYPNIYEVGCVDLS